MKRDFFKEKRKNRDLFPNQIRDTAEIYHTILGFLGQSRQLLTSEILNLSVFPFVLLS